jgi:hypothetical protein
MRIFLIATLLLCAAFPVAAAPRVALLAAGEHAANVADRLLADTKNLEFVERQDLEKLIAERKMSLQQLSGDDLASIARVSRAELFVVFRDLDAGQVECLIFESTAGFRLTDQVIPDADPIPAAAKLLQDAAAKLAAPGQLRFISFVGIRNNGIGPLYWKEAQKNSAEFRRRLSRFPEVILLERDYLDQLIRERQLTGEFGRLAGAARNITIGFAPGSAANTCVVSLRLADADGKLCFAAELPGENPDWPAMMIEKLAAFLQTAPPPPETKADRAAESLRFAAEARRPRLGETERNGRLRFELYRTAYFLDPDNPGLQIEILNDSHTWPWNRENPAAAIDYIELLDAMVDTIGWHQWRIFSQEESWLARLNYERKKLSETDQERLQAPLARLRTAMDQKNVNRLVDFLDPYPKKDKTERLHSLREIIDNGVERLSGKYYFNDPLAVAEGEKQWAMMKEYYDLGMETEEGTKHFSSIYSSRNYADERFFFDYILAHPAAARAEAVRKVAANCRAMSVIPQFRKMAQLAKIAGLVYEDPPTPEGWQSFLNKAFAKLPPPESDMNQDCYLFLRLQKNRVDDPKLQETFDRMLDDHFSRRKPMPTPDQPQTPAPSKDDQVRRLAAEMRKKKPEKRAETIVFQHPDPKCDIHAALANELHPEFHFTELWRCPENVPNADRNTYILDAAADRAGHSYWLVFEPPWRIVLYRCDGSNGKISRLNQAERIPAFLPFPSAYDSTIPRRMTVGKNFAVVAQSRAVVLIPLDGSPSRSIADWPDKVNSAVIAGTRLYCSVGTMLLSCDLEGKDRKVHLTSFREDRETPRKYQIQQLLVDPAEKVLYFVEDNSFNSFDLQTGVEKQLFVVPVNHYGVPSEATIQDGEVLFLADSANRNRPLLRTFYLAENAEAPSIASGKDSDRQPARPKPTASSPIALRGRCIRVGRIIFSCAGPAIPHSPDNTPFWLFPFARNVLPGSTPDRFRLVTSKYVFEISVKKPPESAGR